MSAWCCKLGVLEDNVSFDLLEKWDKYFSGVVLLDMEKDGQMRFVRTVSRGVRSIFRI
jgi:hypothetical protein